MTEIIGRRHVCWLTVAMLLSPGLHAHSETAALMTVEVDDARRVTVGVELSTLDTRELFPAGGDELLSKYIRISTNAGACERIENPKESAPLSFTTQCPKEMTTVDIGYGLSNIGELDVKSTAVVITPKGRRMFVLDRSHNKVSVPLEFDGQLDGFLGAFKLGVEHFSQAWDHLAFLLCLLLSCIGLRSFLASSFGFTLGHTMSLFAVAGAGLRFPEQLVEPAIAATIIWVSMGVIRSAGSATVHASPADTNALRPGVLAVFFGLVHGMGFAGALVDTKLAPSIETLLGFNIGLEVIQLCAALPMLLVAGAMSRIGGGRQGRLLLASGLLVYGTYLFLTRL